MILCTLGARPALIASWFYRRLLPASSLHRTRSRSCTSVADRAFVATHLACLILLQK